MNTKHLISSLGVMALACLVPVAVAEKWDMAMAYADSSYHTQLAKRFAAAVKTATDDKLDIVIHNDGSLFKGNEIKRAVQTGQVPIGERLLSSHENENIVYGADSVPFLVTTFDEADALWQASRPEIEKALAGDNLVLLYSVPFPPQGLYYNKEVKNLADAKGVKFRTYNAAGQWMAELMGMLPVRIENAEIIQALATGVVDGLISSAATGYDRKIWEHLSHHYTVNAWTPRNYVFVNKDAWDSLDKDTQNILKGVSAITEHAGIQEVKYHTDWYFGQLRDNGMVVENDSPQLRASLVEIDGQMKGKWLAKAGALGKAIVSSFARSR